MRPFTLLTLLAVAVIAAPLPASATTVYYSEAAFLAAAGAVSSESFESLVVGDVADSFALPLFSVNSDLDMEVLGIPNAVDTPIDGDQMLINYNFTAQVNISSRFDFTLAQPSHSFGLWVYDWGTRGGDGTAWTWSTNAGDALQVAHRPNVGNEWQFIGFINASTAFTTVRLDDPGNDGDGYAFDRVLLDAQAVPESSALTQTLLGVLALAVAAVTRRTLQT
jgi:hypothetical protein